MAKVNNVPDRVPFNPWQGKYQDLMIDLESVGVVPNAGLVQIGAVWFNPNTGEMGKRFKMEIDPRTAQEAGLEVNMDTILWWMTQSQEAQKSVFKDPDNGYNSTINHINNVLHEFGNFVRSHKNRSQKKFYVWGNGSASDNVWLRENYRHCKLNCPFTFRDDLCLRTLFTLVKRSEGIEVLNDIKARNKNGVLHDGLQDAINQVGMAVECLNVLGLSLDK